MLGTLACPIMGQADDFINGVRTHIYWNTPSYMSYFTLFIFGRTAVMLTSSVEHDAACPGEVVMYLVFDIKVARYVILLSQIAVTQLAVESPFLQVECSLRISKVQQKGLQ